MSNNENRRGRRSYRNSEDQGVSRNRFIEKNVCWLIDENKILKKELGRIKSALDQVVSIMKKQGYIINLKREKRNSIPYFNDIIVDQDEHREEFEKQINEFDRNENTIEISIEDNEIDGEEDNV